MDFQQAWAWWYVVTVLPFSGSLARIREVVAAGFSRVGDSVSGVLGAILGLVGFPLVPRRCVGDARPDPQVWFVCACVSEPLLKIPKWLIGGTE